jgi:hypothetical protein
MCIFGKEVKIHVFLVDSELSVNCYSLNLTRFAAIKYPMQLLERGHSNPRAMGFSGKEIGENSLKLTNYSLLNESLHSNNLEIAAVSEISQAEQIPHLPPLHNTTIDRAYRKSLVSYLVILIRRHHGTLWCILYFVSSLFGFLSRYVTFLQFSLSCKLPLLPFSCQEL